MSETQLPQTPYRTIVVNDNVKWVISSCDTIAVLKVNDIPEITINAFSHDEFFISSEIFSGSLVLKADPQSNRNGMIPINNVIKKLDKLLKNMDLKDRCLPKTTRVKEILTTYNSKSELSTEEKAEFVISILRWRIGIEHEDYMTSPGKYFSCMMPKYKGSNLSYDLVARLCEAVNEVFASFGSGLEINPRQHEITK